MVGSPDGSCLDEGVITLICGIINCVADFATTVTPIPLIMGVSTLISQSFSLADVSQLHMPKRQRFAVAALFGMGLIVTAAGIVRTWYIYKSLMTTYDNTW